MDVAADDQMDFFICMGDVTGNLIRKFLRRAE